LEHSHDSIKKECFSKLSSFKRKKCQTSHQGGFFMEANMANHHRGEIDAVIGGERRNLCLTLGALAELEAALGVGDMTALAERFEQGRVGARDAIAIIGAGLRGAGHAITDEDVKALPIDGGAAGAVRIVAELLTATFGLQEPVPANP
jgi:hypothetical protein